MNNSLRVVQQRIGYFVAAAALVLAVMMPAIVSAASVTERSIALSSSSVDATGVTYQVNFTPDGDAGAFVVDFCGDSPVVGQTCTAPTGFVASAAASDSTGFTDVEAGASQVIVTGPMTAGMPVSVEVTGITNPSASGPLYARVVTYDTKISAQTYTSTDLKTGAVDQGGVAMSITDTVGVSGTVLETMTFCVSGAAITENCGGVTSPVLELGETSGSGLALDAGTVSDGSIFTQISTNASSGAIISLKSSALDCGGLLRAGAPDVCDIEPAMATGITAGQAKFGVKTAAATDTGANANGVLQPVTGSDYNDTTYALNALADNSTGVTSTYGDKFLGTDGAPVNNKNMELTFGASISNQTPAGLYSADLSMIATGKF